MKNFLNLDQKTSEKLFNQIKNPTEALDSQVQFLNSQIKIGEKSSNSSSEKVDDENMEFSDFINSIFKVDFLQQCEALRS